jgi:protein SCO1/2
MSDTKTNWIARGVLITTLAWLGTGCDLRQKSDARTPDGTDTTSKVFYVKGILKELKPDGRTAVIEHEEIPNYMAKMTMPLQAKDPKELAGLQPNDLVHFRLVVTKDDGWIDQVTKVGTTTNAAPSIPHTRLVRDVEPLKVGDAMPNYPFTTELGQPLNLRDLKGKTYAFTFIFTRCPFPVFCPRMGENFAAVQRILSQPGQPANWQLFSISFDVENDTPSVLKNYAQQRFKYNPARWSFLTGAIIEIDALTEQFGLYFARSESGMLFDHNLRTVVVDAAGRIQSVFIGNEWKPEELAAELVKGAAAK